MDLPFVVYIDGKEQKQFFCEVQGEKLILRITPRQEWPPKLQEILTEIRHSDGQASWTEKLPKPTPALREPISLWAFEVPTSEYKELEQHIQELRDKSTVLGDFRTLVLGDEKDTATITLKPDHYYDFFAFATSYQGNRIMCGGGRLSTVPGEVPKMMTFEELKAFTIEDLDLSLEQAGVIKATVTPMTAWGNGPGRYIVAGFDFGGPSDTQHYGVMVNHMGGVEHYHGYTTKEIRSFLGINEDASKSL